MKKNIALIAGGYSGEVPISLSSSVMIEKVLDKNKYNVYKIIIDKLNWYYTDGAGKRFEINKTDFSLCLDQTKILFDCAFIIIHGTPGEDGKLQGYFEMLEIPYTTCDSITSALTFNKAFCNAVVKGFNVVNISNSIHIFKNSDISDDEILQKISLPCFVKPNAGGSSVGMSKVSSKEELRSAIDKAFLEDEQVLIEEYVKGRELTCGMIRTKGEELIFPVTEIISKKDFFDFEAKYKGMSDEITPALISEDLKNRIQNTSHVLYQRLNCKGIVRFDYIYNEDAEKLYFLEVNTVPGQSEKSIVPQQAAAMGISTSQLYDLLIESVI